MISSIQGCNLVWVHAALPSSEQYICSYYDWVGSPSAFEETSSHHSPMQHSVNSKHYSFHIIGTHYKVDLGGILNAASLLFCCCAYLGTYQFRLGTYMKITDDLDVLFGTICIIKLILLLQDYNMDTKISNLRQCIKNLMTIRRSNNVLPLRLQSLAY